MSARAPKRRPDGRPGPPPGYPNDGAKYADPANWKYPVHSPFHARAARRYFNDPRNRAKYTAAEQEFVDRRIDAALTRLGVAVKFTAGAMEPEATTLQEDLPTATAISAMGRDDLLRVLLGRTRLRAAKGISESAVRFVGNRGGRLEAAVKQYRAVVDFKERLVAHDCADFVNNRARGRLLCKHLGRLFLNLREDQATPLLRTLLQERGLWEFRG